MGLRDFFLKGFTGEQAIHQDLIQQVVWLKAFCRGDSSPDEDKRLMALFNLSVAMLPYLTTTELDRVWKSLESGQCLRSQTSLESQWYRMFKAVGRRDVAEMLEGARDLFKNWHQLTSVEQKYLVAAGMLGALAQGNRPEAHRLWSQYKTALFGNSEPDLLFRLLAAEANVN